MSQSSYSEKLRDPRWQRKRLEIMQRDEFTCQKCYASDETLNVHHCYYEDNNDPWEYPDSSLLTLCEICHGEENSFAARKNLLIKALGEKGFITEDIIDFCSAFNSAEMPTRDYVFMSVLCHWLRSPEHRHFMHDVYFEELGAKNRKHPDGGPTADSLITSATGRDSCESGKPERKDEGCTVA